MVHATTEQRRAWAAADDILHVRMREHVPAALEHNGEEEFAKHLIGVQSVLRSWGAEEHVTNAALFHSIYGTEGFQGYKLPLSYRAEIAALIGARAERLAWIFCVVDRHSVDETVLHPLPAGMLPAFVARPELGAFTIPLKSQAEWVDFLTLTLADWLEQVEGAASKAVPRPVGDGVLWRNGEAWAYRREAYAAMAKLLGEQYGVSAAPEMYEAVFAREPAWSQGLVQPKTPPMGVAAQEAYDAMASAALDFGND